MFELVSVRRVGAHPGEHQHGVSIQISKSSGKTFLRISRIRNNPLTWFLATVFVYILPFISRFWTLCINGFDFYFGLFWMAWHWKPAISCIWTVASITRTMYWTPKKVEKKKQCTGARNIEFQWLSHFIWRSVVGWFCLSQNVKQLYFSNSKTHTLFTIGFVLLPYIFILYNLEVSFNFHFTFLELNVIKMFIVQ